jgi:hypothetical protein
VTALREPLGYYIYRIYYYYHTIIQMISRHISCTYTRPVFTVTCPHIQAINVMSTPEYASSWFMFRIRRVYNCLIALNKLLDLVILLPSTRDCSFSILLGKPLERQNQIHCLSVCKFDTFHLYSILLYTSRLVPALSTQGYKGIPFR